METIDRPSHVETIVLEELRSFFANPRHFDGVVFSVRRSTSQLARKLEEITDEFIEIDQQSNCL
jgi:hypothetical protein